MKVSDVCKYFSFLQALKIVSFEVGHNEVVGLIKALPRAYQPELGRGVGKGEKLSIFSLHAACDLGIVTAFQDRARR